MIIRAQVQLPNAIHSMAGFNRSTLFRIPDERRGRISVKSFLSDQRGLNTVELVVIIAIVIGLALLFRGRITAFVTVLLDGLFSDETAKTLVDGVQVGK